MSLKENASRRWLTALLALLVAASLIAATGCGDDDESSGDSGSASQQSANAPGKCESMDSVKAQTYEGNIINLALYVAEDQGFFENNCLVVEQVPIVSAPVAFAQSVQGSVNLVNTAPDNVLNARKEGLDVKVFANMMDRLYYALVVSSKTGLQSQKDDFDAVMKGLVGKRIGVTSLGTNTEAIAKSNFRAAGLNPDDATYVALGALPQMLAALENGSVEAVEMFGSGPELAAAQKLGFVVGDLRREGEGSEEVQALNGSTLMWAAHTSFLDENKDLVERFKKANDDAIAWIRDEKNRAELHRITAESAPYPPDTPNGDKALEQVTDIFAEIMNPRIDKESLQNWVDFTVKNGGTLKEPIPVEEFVWEGGSQ